MPRRVQGFPGGDTNVPELWLRGSSPGVFLRRYLRPGCPAPFVAPNTQQWNLTIQHALGKKWVLELGYVGTHAVHLRETRTDSARSSPRRTIPLSSPPGRHQYHHHREHLRQWPRRAPRNPGINGYSGMQIFANDAYSHYHSLQATVSRRWSAGYFQAAYTFSESTDATSTGNTALNTAFNDRESTRRILAGSRISTARIASSSATVTSCRSSRTPKDGSARALSGWAISGITIFQSGTPFSVLDNSAGFAFLGGLQAGVAGAQLVDGGSIPAGYTHGDIHSRVDNGYLDRDEFRFRSPGRSRRLRPGLERLPLRLRQSRPQHLSRTFQQNWDFSLIKNFRITERQELRFTTDFFNIWNHANFANPSTTEISSTAFGRIFSTVGTPRLIQFSLRYSF